jgi:hypothetical protein
MGRKRAGSEIIVEEETILTIRGHKVMLDSDLAALYGVTTKAFNQAVKRNKDRFPRDFMFRLNVEEAREVAGLRSQSVTSKGGRRYLPYVFTQEGVSMLSAVLNSERAVEVSIAIMRTFVRMRLIIPANKELLRKVIELETRVIKHDRALGEVFDAIRQLMDLPPATKKRRIGF